MIIEMIQRWIKEQLTTASITNLSGTFDTVNTKCARTPRGGHYAGRQERGILQHDPRLSETVIVSHRRHILTFVMCYELIQLIVEKNKSPRFDTWLFWKWIFKPSARCSSSIKYLGITSRPGN